MAINLRYHVTFKKKTKNKTTLFYSTSELPLKRRLSGLDLFLGHKIMNVFIKNKRNIQIFSKKHNQGDYTNTGQTFEDSLRFWSECHSTVFTMEKKVVPFGIESTKDNGDRLE